MEQNQLAELKTLVAEIRADHEEAKRKEKANAWTKYVSLSMIILAVLATIAGGKGGGYSSTVMKELNEATFNQAAASDQWAYYQAKGVKQTLMELELDRNPNDTKTAEKMKRYEAERKAIAAEATGAEKKRDRSRENANHAAEAGKAMGLASSLFQIAIAIGGICLIVRKRWLWYISLGGGILAGIQMAYVIYYIAKVA